MPLQCSFPAFSSGFLLISVRKVDNKKLAIKLINFKNPHLFNTYYFFIFMYAPAQN